MIQSIEEGRKEDGNRSIADKILKRLHDLDKTIGTNQGRWAWELLQNAKDSIADDDEKDRAVSVKIVLNENSVEFHHNGTHFSEQDVRGLINQISSKEVVDRHNAKKTGRFGTGFLTTHLLSRVIHVKGIVETTDNNFYKFEFPLDRQGKITTDLMPKIEKAWSEFHKSAIKVKSEFDRNDFNTSFIYHLETEEQKRIAIIGIQEFIKLLPYVLAFIPKIESIDITNSVSGKNIIFENANEYIDEIILPITKVVNGNKSQVFIGHLSNDSVAIAAEFSRTNSAYAAKDTSAIPKLFCDFPLIGTENFHFPVVVNSFHFNPTTERDFIWLNGDEDQEVIENRELIMSAVQLYKKLITCVENNNYSELFNVSETKMPVGNENYFDDTWYRESIQSEIRDIVAKSKIVEIESDDVHKKSAQELYFPLKSYSESVQIKIWQVYFDMYPNLVCKQSQIKHWCNVSWESWNRVGYQQIALELASQASITNLMATLNKNERDAINWLNIQCKFILEDETNLSLFENNSIIPNQNGNFCKRTELFIDEIQDETLKNILHLLGENWKEILLHNGVAFGKYYVKKKNDIAAKITELLKNPRFKDANFVEAITLLSEWFENNKKEGEELFSEIYRKRAELFMNTITDKENLYKVMRSRTELAKLAEIAKTIDDNPGFYEKIQMTSDMINLMKEFNVSNVDELKTLLVSAQNASAIMTKIQITQDTLVSLGVTSIEELEEALKDKDLASKFVHTSTPSFEMFKYVQGLIARAKTNIIGHLQSLPDYDCSEFEELATTVIGGIRKEGLPIHVVVRPSDNGEVIVYYSSEKDTLDYANAELWIDNGRDVPRLLTLGKILKNTGINRIPV